VLGFLTGLYPVGFEGRIHYNNDMQQKYKSTFMYLTEKTLEIDIRTTR